MWITPCSTFPVTTVPRPVIENTSSIGIKNGFSRSRTGSGTNESTASINSNTCCAAASSPSNAFNADTRTTGVSSPGNSYSVNSSRTSISTNSNKLLIIHHVHLVQRHHDRRHPHLTSQQHMLTSLRHRTIRRRHHQNRPIHLRRTRNHVLDVIRMPRHIHMRIMPIRRLILHMRNIDRDPPLPLLRRLIDHPQTA